MEYIITGLVIGMSLMLCAAYEYGKYRVVKKWWEEDDLCDVVDEVLSIPAPMTYEPIKTISLHGYQVTYVRGCDEKFDFTDCAYA